MALAFCARDAAKGVSMAIKIQTSKDGKHFAIELFADADMDRWYSSRNFVVVGGNIEMLISALESANLIPPRPPAERPNASLFDTATACD